MRAPFRFLPLLALAACAPPVLVYRPAADAVAAERDPLSVTLRDGRRMTVRNAHVERDTLFGSAAAGRDSVTEVRIAIGDVERITRDERGLNAIGTGAVALMVGILLGGLVILGLIVASSG